MKELQFYQQLAIAEPHRRLEKEVQAYQRSERLICFYLLQIKRRRGYEDFGFANVEDYALELLGFSPSKTRQLLALCRKLLALPKVTEALARGDIGWTKASKVAMVATAKGRKGVAGQSRQPFDATTRKAYPRSTPTRREQRELVVDW